MESARALLLKSLRGVVQFIRETLSENGQGSFSRFGSALLIAAYIRVMLKNNAIPPNSEGFAAVILTLYGATKFVEGITALRASAPPQASIGASVGASNQSTQPDPEDMARLRSIAQGGP